MIASAFDESRAKFVENEVCTVFGCSVSDLVGFSDTEFKKVLVYLLSRHCGFDKHTIGRYYQMTYLFVPTVVERVEWKMVREDDFREKIFGIIENLNSANPLQLIHV